MIVSAIQYTMISITILFAVAQMEWLVTVRTSHRNGIREALCSSISQQRRAFIEKQKIDKPIVVLTDLPHRYQSLQVLIGLVRVDVV